MEGSAGPEARRPMSANFVSGALAKAYAPVGRGPRTRVGMQAQTTSYSTSSSLRRSGAVLYRAIRQQDGQAVLLKVPTSQEPRQAERLRNELEIGTVLASAAILRPLALDVFQGAPMLVLEDFAGVPLDQLGPGPMAPGRFLPLAAQITAALAEVHQRGVIHKNLTPSTIFIDTATAEVRLGDLDLAALAPRQQQVTRAPRLIEGSLPYLPPEQTGWMNRAIDARSDLYSLGVTFYQLLVGRLPFDARDPLEWVHCHIARTPIPPAEAAPGVPLPLSHLVMKLLAKVAEDRYQSARGLQHDLELCLAAWRSTGRIEFFPLATQDVSDRFQVTQTLYGRDHELALLGTAFERTLTGDALQLVLVRGSSGAGKSVLVNELRKPVVRQHGWFLSGKFDPYKRDIPYATIAQALHGWVIDILTSSDDEIAAWRTRLLAALGAHGQLVIDVIPALQALIGRQPPLPALAQNETQQRFSATFAQFLSAICRVQPVVLFLDDLQWADAASLALLDQLRHRRGPDEPADDRRLPRQRGPAGHPLLATVAAIRDAGVSVEDVALAPLSVEHLAQLIADTVHCTSQLARPLAALVQEKTAGNAYFALQFLMSLHHEGLISFDPQRRLWRWDVDKIRSRA